MKKNRFFIRPIYQRDEVMDRKKSSSIIESILLGIKLPPIFVYKRKNGISEVIDGQQRLLSILGFLGKPFINEKGQAEYSKKKDYNLYKSDAYLIEGISGKKFIELSDKQKDKIEDFDLWIIEIAERNNEHFDPIDLFIRLNNKPYPIKEHTFEMWNSFVDVEIIKAIKEMNSRHENWFFFRKNNKRMENENLLTRLTFLEFKTLNKKVRGPIDDDIISIYAGDNQHRLRLKSLNDITKEIQNAENRSNFLTSADNLEKNFLKKLNTIVRHIDDTQKFKTALDFLLQQTGTLRSQQKIYLLWYLLKNIPFPNSKTRIMDIINDLTMIFSTGQGPEKTNTKEAVDLDKMVKKFWEKHQ